MSGAVAEGGVVTGQSDLPAPLPSAVDIAKALLDKEDDGVEQRWKGLSDTELEDEIAAYREGIQAFSKELEARGIEVSLQEEAHTNEEPARASIPGVEVSS